ncbi:MAG TPA: sulfatase-like hydrolase/transferase [Acidimicrobiia bacterium]|nr:sulfatase-like hydrolase/transferase [Acidimicrobiia bacterium]
MRAACVVAAAAFNLPILIWARNSWDLSSPNKLLVLGGSLALVGCGVVWLLSRFGIDIQAASLGVGIGLMVFVYWKDLPDIAPVIWIAVVAAMTGGGHLLRGSRILDGVTVVLIAVVGVAPLVELVFAHFEHATPYPLVGLTDSDTGVTPTEAVEDVIVVIVDGYPSLRIAEDWFEHDASPLIDHLSSIGFQVIPEAWSQHTFTAPSVSALLELHPVVDDGPPEPWGNLGSFYTITRGDSFVSRTLRNAGFTYTHFESGWDATTCGEGVDRCVASPWIDETVAGFIDSTALGNWVEQRLGNYVVDATMHTTEGLTRLGHDLAGNGSHDYIFAHLALPHDPPVVNETCEFEEERAREDLLFLEGLISVEDRRRAIADQMTCVDSLIRDIADVAGPSTAMIITGDHGTGTGGQIPRAPSEWTDSDVAERFGIFLAYRLPSECDEPHDAISTLVMRVIVSCAVHVGLPNEKSGHLIGLAVPEWVEPSRMQDIRLRLAAGSLGPNAEEE